MPNTIEYLALSTWSKNLTAKAIWKKNWHHIAQRHKILKDTESKHFSKKHNNSPYLHDLTHERSQLGQNMQNMDMTDPQLSAPFSPFRLLYSAIWLCPIRHGFSHDTFAGFCHLSLPDNRRRHLKNKDATMILCLDVYWCALMCHGIWLTVTTEAFMGHASHISEHREAKSFRVLCGRDTKLKPSKAAMEQDAQEFAHLQDGFDLFNLPPDWSLHNGLAEPQILVRPGWQRLLKKATLSKVIWKWECSKEGITVAHFTQSHGEKNTVATKNVT